MPRSSVGVAEGPDAEVATREVAEPVDSFSDSNTAHVMNNLDNAVAQSFTAKRGVLASAVGRVSKTGSPTGNIVAKIYAHTQTYGVNSMPTGAALATSDAIDVTTLTASESDVRFVFSGANRITLTEGTHYVVSFEYGTGDASNTVNVRYHSSGAHSGNFSRRQFTSWASFGARDTWFIVNVARHIARWQKDSRFATPPKRYCITITTAAQAGGGGTLCALKHTSGNPDIYVHRVTARQYVTAAATIQSYLRLLRMTISSGTTVPAADVPKLDTGAANPQATVYSSGVGITGAGNQDLFHAQGSPTIGAGGGAGPDEFDSGGDHARAIRLTAGDGIGLAQVQASDADIRYLVTFEWEEE